MSAHAATASANTLSAAGPQTSITGTTGKLVDTSVDCYDADIAVDVNGNRYWHNSVYVGAPSFTAAAYNDSTGAVNTQWASFKIVLYRLYNGVWSQAAMTRLYSTYVTYTGVGVTGETNVYPGWWYDEYAKKWVWIGRNLVANWDLTKPGRYQVWDLFIWYPNDKTPEAGQAFGPAEYHMWHFTHTQPPPDQYFTPIQYHCPGNWGWTR